MSLFDEDPAAEFLSREQEAIGDVLGGDNFELIADNPAPAADQALDFLDEAPVAIPPAMSEPEVLAAPIMSEPEIVAAPAAEPIFAPEPEVEAEPAPEAEPVFAAAPVYEALAEAAEPESIRKWRLEQAEEIAARDAESEEKRAEWKAEAARELENWHSKQNEVLAKTKAGNREAQEAFLKESKESKEGAQWETICKLCDFNPKSNRNCKDTSRMRSIFLQLKQNPLVR